MRAKIVGKISGDSEGEEEPVCQMTVNTINFDNDRAVGEVSA